MTVVVDRLPFQDNIAVATSSTKILGEPGNIKRIDLILTNTGDYPISIGVGRDAETDVGITLQPTGSVHWSMSAGYNVPQHAIYAIADGTASSLGVFMRSES